MTERFAPISPRAMAALKRVKEDQDRLADLPDSLIRDVLARGAAAKAKKAKLAK